MRAIVLGLAVWILSAASAGCDASPDPEGSSVGAANSSTARPVVGAIRWDGWQDGGPIGDANVALLGPKKWRYRLPFYGREISETQVQLRENSQAVMDQEIAYARAGGLDYWAFNHYLVELRQSLNLYLSSSHKSDINFCLDMGALSPARVADAVNLIKTEPTYQKVAGGRPLVYVQTWYLNRSGVTRADVDNFRFQLVQAGFPNPYIVAQHWNADTAASYANRFGLDAIGAYATVGGGTYREAPFSELDSVVRKFWRNSKNTGKRVVPIVMTGWDPRPAWEDTSGSSSEYNAGVPPGIYYTTATPQQIATQLKGALDWSAANPGAAGEPNAILIYAWNEITEGGWLLPSNTAFNPVGTGRLDAIAAVLRTLGPRPSAPAGAPRHRQLTSPTDLPGEQVSRVRRGRSGQPRLPALSLTAPASRARRVPPAAVSSLSGRCRALSQRRGDQRRPTRGDQRRG